jgi:hypothetical protein
MTTKQIEKDEAARAHTPGPWSVGEDNVGDGCNIRDANGNRVAHTATSRNHGTEKIDPAEAKANARLIAAAPDLLKALKELLDASEASPDDLPAHEYESIVADAHNRARAALSRAEGK